MPFDPMQVFATIDVAESFYIALMGAVVGIPINLYFAWKSNKQYKEASESLERTMSIIGSAMMHGKENAELKRDENGKLIGVLLKSEFSGSTSCSGALAAAVSRQGGPPEPVELQPHPDNQG